MARADAAGVPGTRAESAAASRDLRAADRLAVFFFLYGAATIGAVATALAFPLAPLESLRGLIPSPFLATLPELLARGEAGLLRYHALLAIYGAGMMLCGRVLGRRVVAEALRLERRVTERAFEQGG